VTNLSYDALNRPTGKTYSNCPATAAVTYGYDAYDPQNGQYGNGRRTSVSDASGLAVWKYDVRGRVVSESRQITGYGQFTTSFTYREASFRTTPPTCR
jgi:hypothetical protein